MSDATPSKTTTPQTAPARQAPATREHEQLSNAAVASGRQHLAGNQAVTGMLQAASEDIPPESVISLQRLVGNQAVQRMLSSHTLQRETLEGRKAEQTTDQSAPPIVYEVLRSPGQPLDTATRTAMESQLGHDFSRVRIHNDAQAAESAAAVDAHAYTVGHDVVFGPGQYTPQTGQRQETLAHELTHVIQQSNAASSNALTIGPVDDRYEQEADMVSAMLSTTRPVVGVDRNGSVPDHFSIQRAPEKKKPPKKEKKPEKTEAEKEQEEEKRADELRESASEEDRDEVDDLIDTIEDVVWLDDQMPQPVHFARNWEVIQSQITNPKTTPKLKIKDPEAKRPRILFPELYDVDLVKRLAEIKKKGLSLIVIHDLHQQLRDVMSTMKKKAEGEKGVKDTKDYEEEHRQFLEEIKPLANNVTLDAFISMHDALVQKFLPPVSPAATPAEGEVSVADPSAAASTTSDFDRALPEIKQFYTKPVKAEFLENLLIGGRNTLVHPVMKQQLGKAATFLATYKNGEWSNKVKVALSRTPTDIGGLEIRPNKNNPEKISEHAFGRAVDFLPKGNPNVHQKDFPEKMVQAFTGEDVYKGQHVRTIQQGSRASMSPQEMLNAVTALHEASNKFKWIYKNEKNFGEGLKEYLESEEKQPLKIGATELFDLVRHAYEDREQKQREQKEGKKKKKGKQESIPASFQPPPVSYDRSAPYDQLLFALERNDVPATKLNERAQFLLEAYELFALSHRWVWEPGKELPNEGEATRYNLEEHAAISVQPEVQGTSATIAAYGFINLPNELITALTHSEGGNLNWLGAGEHTKDFMHFELKPSDESRLPGEQGSGSAKKTAPPVQPRGKKAEKDESPGG